MQAIKVALATVRTNIGLLLSSDAHRSHWRRPEGPPEGERSVRLVAMEVAERRKPNCSLRSEAVRRTLRVSQESKKEIPVHSKKEAL